ncbi:fasciclin domain-containing protein [Hyphobacterium sp. HN65]|uniref:Fasciclin domain-containing protein n=1 Tax=Hyphobacterium lacteum TaxID=3116575 RepID=A0ABU7LRR7_9PROT|nr:fasciclin domain-containing protein [Hyphobacterium sp. HN65]MEE2526336.1 fasciclin domain-containing protein [Hyphobacterium sp. HN65]
MRKILFSLAATAALAAPALAHDADLGAIKVKMMDGHGSHAAMQSDIVDTAISAGSFNTLVAAVQAAGLVDVLRGDGPFTVFAPTDEAFAALGEDTIASLLEPENREQLVSILTYHVVPGEYFAGDLQGQRLSVASVQGDTIDVDATHGSVMIDGATVINADVDASNGVIHVINEVIMPGTH